MLWDRKIRSHSFFVTNYLANYLTDCLTDDWQQIGGRMMKAIILAAGKGSRLGKMTESMPKAMIPLAGKPLLMHTLDRVKENDVQEVIIVIGYCGQYIKDHVGNRYEGMKITYVWNKDYEKTNNIYSLYLAAPYLDEDTILLEADLYYDRGVLEQLLAHKIPCAILVSPYNPAIMSGTVIAAEQVRAIEMIPAAQQRPEVDYLDTYKTVNIYYFEKDFLQKLFLPELQCYMTEQTRNCYYELALGELIRRRVPGIEIVSIPEQRWLEVDTPEDYQRAQEILRERDLVSVIIPVYNARESLKRCVDSARKQTHSNLEILLVDDGSTDDSLELCLEYEAQDERIRVIHQENRGVASARNAALKQARGHYIQFIDSDDHVREEWTETLLKAVQKHHADLGVCSYYEVTEQGTAKTRFDFDGTYGRSEYLEKMMGDPTDYYYGVLWNKMYRRSIIQKHSLQFEEKQQLGEDFIFNLQYLVFTEQLTMCEAPLYYYVRLNQDSLARSHQSTEESVDNRIELYHCYQDFFRKIGLYEEHRAKIDAYIVKHAAYEYDRILFKAKKLSWWKKCKKMHYVSKRCLREQEQWNLRNQLWVTVMAILANNRFAVQFRGLKNEYPGRERWYAIFIRTYAMLIKRSFLRLRNAAIQMHIPAKRRILLYCESPTMEEHLIHYYETVKKIRSLEWYLYYDPEYCSEERQMEGIQRICQGRKIQVLERPGSIYRIVWNLVVAADGRLPKLVKRIEQPALYVNHGLHMVSFDRGENLYAYSRWWGTEADGTPRFNVMLESNYQYALQVMKDNPLLQGIVKGVGYKESDEIREAMEKREEYREILGFQPEEKVLAVFSTWGRDSLFQCYGKELIAQMDPLLSEGYRIILSVHPREYTGYEQQRFLAGAYVDSQEVRGYIVRKPEQDFMPYLIAADVVLSDYSSMYEIALMAGKRLILCDYPKNRLWKKSITYNIRREVPLYSGEGNLRSLIEEAESGSCDAIYARYQRELLAPEQSYQQQVCEITEQLLENN